MSALHKKVLVVDDDPVVGRSFDRVLSERGYAVITAANGQEALDRMAREDYDMVFTDIRMPGMDGIDVAAEIKARQPWMPVVIVTGYGTADAQARAKEVGVTAFLHKPLSSDAIEASAREALQAAAAPVAQAAAIAVPLGLPVGPKPAPVEIVEVPAKPEPVVSSAANDEPEATWAEVGAGAGRFLRNVGLFIAAPFVSLAYIVLFPFVGLGMLAWMGIGALRKRVQTK
jgi:CheY-like chemotaxis protein